MTLSWKDKIKGATEILLDVELEPEGGTVTRMSKRRLSEVDVDSFMEAAAEQDDPLWEYIQVFLVDLRRTAPIRAAKLEREIRWMRHQAYKAGLHWGKRSSRWHHR